MADDNGAGRIDRIEQALERLVDTMAMADRRLEARFTQLSYLINDMHEATAKEFKFMLGWQVIAQEQMDKQTALQRVRDERIEKLILAIGELIKRLPERKEG